MKLSISYNCKLEVVDFNKETPIFYAVFNNHIEAVWILISYKVNLDVVNKYNLTPIMIAEKNHFDEIFKLLYESGAKFTRKFKRNLEDDNQDQERNHSDTSMNKSKSTKKKSSI